MDFTEAVRAFAEFDLKETPDNIEIYGEGNINTTYRVRTREGGDYILQKVNTKIFTKYLELMSNIVGVTEFLSKKIKAAGGNPDRETLTLVKTKDGNSMHIPNEGELWRMYLFISGATAYQSAEKSGILFEAARSFGIFQNQLSDYPAHLLHETIPNFHNTHARYLTFLKSLEKDAAGRAAEIKEETDILKKYSERSELIIKKLESGEIPTRVTHNDTKLNNIMIDDTTGKGICVIDLDTVMPGSLLYDFGDSIRFAANNTAEDDPDTSKIFLRLDLFEEYTSGFLAGVGNAITKEELDLLPMSAFILTYELALRFCTDYLDGDTYFRLKYPSHNLDRTRAQIKLMLDIDEKFDEMAKIVEKCRKTK